MQSLYLVGLTYEQGIRNLAFKQIRIPESYEAAFSALNLLFISNDFGP